MELHSYTLLALGSLAAILNPLGTVPTFLAVTEGSSDDERIAMARRGCLVAFFAMAAFALLGTRILASFRVGIPALQMAGGIVILRVGLEMLGGTRRRLTPEESREAVEKDDVAITPIGVPLLCGPGSITTAMVLQSQATDIAQHLVLVASISVIYAGTFYLLWAAVRYSAVVSQLAMRVVSRLMGLLLAALAVQLVLNGMAAAFPRIFAEAP